MDDAGQVKNSKFQDPNDKPEDNLAGVVEEIEEKQEDFQAAYNAGGHFKEQLEAISKGFRAGERESVSSKQHEVKEIEEIPENPEVGPEVESHLERIEKDPAQMQKMADDYVKTVGVKPVSTGNQKVVLPLTDDQIKSGLHHKVWEAIRWLAEWCVRQLKVIRSHT